jgi:recombinational DNA repair protein RecR
MARERRTKLCPPCMAQHLIMVDQTKASIHYTRLLTFLNHHMVPSKLVKPLSCIIRHTHTHKVLEREREREREIVLATSSTREDGWFFSSFFYELF